MTFKTIAPSYLFLMCLILPLSATADYVVDNMDCKLRMPSYGKEYSTTWSGACAQGYAEGEGTLQVFRFKKPFGSYVGMMRLGRPEGQGTIEWQHNRYEGAWHDGKFHGKGVLTWSNNNRYAGSFEAGEPNGVGLKEWKNGDRYSGMFLKGKRTGEGEYVWANGARYQGGFLNGNPEGSGKMIYADGRVLEGTWKQGHFVSN